MVLQVRDPPCSTGDRRRLRQVIDPPRFKELTPRLASASDQATWRQLRKRGGLDRATRVLVLVWERVIA